MYESKTPGNARGFTLFRYHGQPRRSLTEEGIIAWAGRSRAIWGTTHRESGSIDCADVISVSSNMPLRANDRFGSKPVIL
jgi:hypothetical protein